MVRTHTNEPGAKRARLKRAERLLKGAPARYLLNIESYRVCVQGHEGLVKRSSRRKKLGWNESAVVPMSHKVIRHARITGDRLILALCVTPAVTWLIKNNLNVCLSFLPSVRQHASLYLGTGRENARLLRQHISVSRARRNAWWPIESFLCSPWPRDDEDGENLSRRAQKRNDLKGAGRVGLSETGRHAFKYLEPFLSDAMHSANGRGTNERCTTSPFSNNEKRSVYSFVNIK